MASVLGFYIVNTSSSGTILYTAPADTMVHIKWFRLTLRYASGGNARVQVRDSSDTTTLYELFAQNLSIGAPGATSYTIDNAHGETYTYYSGNTDGSGDSFTSIQSFYLKNGEKLKFTHNAGSVEGSFLAIGEPY